jgi:hypothetical protein
MFISLPLIVALFRYMQVAGQVLRKARADPIKHN